MLVLKTANLEDSAKEYAFMKDMPADENGMKNPWAGCSEEEFTNKALPEMIAFQKEETFRMTMCRKHFSSSGKMMR